MGRGRVDHTAVKRLLNEKKQTLRDSQLFSSRIMAGYFEDIATAQTKRYNYNRRIRVKLVWKPKSEELAVTDNSVIAINSGNKMVTSKKGRLERFWIIFGFFAHELGHLLYSDFLVLQTYMNSLEKFKWYPIKPDLPDPGDKIRESELWDYVKADPKNLQALMLVAKNINNIIEDGYIENRILNNFPGSIGTALEEMRESFFEDIPTVSELIEEENAGERHIFESIMQVMLSYAKFGEIKYGSEPLTDERVQTVFALLDDIDKALLNKSAKERLIATNTILVRCWDYIKEFCEYVKERSNQTGSELEEIISQILGNQVGSSTVGKGRGTPVPEASGTGEKSFTILKRKKTQEEAGNKGEEEGSGAGNEEGEGNSERESGNESESDGGVMMKGDGSGKQEASESEGGRIDYHETDEIDSGDKEGSVERDDDYKREIYDKAASDIERLLDKMAENAACKELEQNRTKELNQAAQNISYGDAHKGINVKIKRIAEVDESLVEQYDLVAAPLLTISRQLQASLLRQLKDSRRGGKQTGLLMGRRLNSSSLHRNDGKVFYKNALPNETPELAVALLIDESGSMRCYDRCTYARAAAIILHDFCDKLDIPIMIYGHTTGDDYEVKLFSYAEFDGYDNNDKYRLMDIAARDCNRDGAALRFVAEQLTKRQEEIKLLILISDGQPADTGYHGTIAEEDLRGIKQEYRRKGVLFVAAAIGNDKENIERIYGDSYMDITDLSDLPAKLTAVVKRHIRV